MDQVQRFDPSLPIEEAPTPPASWYRDERIYALEKQAVFRATWQPVGRLDQVRSPGDYFTGELVGEPFVVARDEEGQLRAFYNVCRHHAAVVAQGQGCTELFVCPYHGWAYRLDGRLRRAPRLGGVKGFDREKFGLVPIPVATWGPFVFIHLGPDPEPLDLSELGRYLPDLDRLTFVTRRTYEIGCNWKVYVDNYLDGGYHVEYLHGDLGAQLDLGGYRTEIHERFSVQLCSAGEGATDRIGGGAVYAWLYPNFMLNRYGPILDTNWVIPLGVDRCFTVFDYFFENPDDTNFIEKSLADSHQVQQEDIDICESVQKGLSSSAYDVGRYAPTVEMGELHFHRLLAGALRGTS